VPDLRRLTVETRWRRHRAIKRDEPHFPLVVGRTRRGPRRVARGGEQNRLLLVGVEGTRATPNKKACELAVFAPDKEFRVMSLLRYSKGRAHSGQAPNNPPPK